ncbi:PREDICTED: pre-mRNA cleavage factor Im 25 kDa subunit 2-like isoform X1 [Erythranthe guttata]|uniref:pre-mRNA cleavage factor Im 25 kDa subunit 2-like isoform X1 n=1 Tax=Erythranthe guttata TaxID=4155 RepID=UPI00064E01CD|nr:PREDICTED: pre-mRNA cleavage factor Im 25 kDa subunit 2-like isoform X1 [Erythranthe guttata]|eukprot:XP_012852128.1 PREDICTED: pre-mRNA cleavage factor Im 25 kDa subunit 2-like isoform X1 [Erythranthe guttata]
MKMAPSPVVRTYPLSSYSFDTKMEKHKSIINPITRLDSIYKTEGIRRIVEGILLVHEHNHPYILLLKVGTAFYKLPGGKLEAGESEINGLKRKLSSKLGPDPPSPQPDWQIGECVGVWWRTNFETSAVYPYCPPHRTKPRVRSKLRTVPCLVMNDSFFHAVDSPFFFFHSACRNAGNNLLFSYPNESILLCPRTFSLFPFHFINYTTMLRY